MGDVYAELLDNITCIDPVIEDVKEPQAVAVAPSTPIYELNVLNSLIMYEFKNEIIAEENEFLTAPVGTTITIDALIDGLKFAVKDLIALLVPTENVVALRCNFSDPIYFAGYSPPTPPPKTNRGRKKKERTGKQRKRQGNGKNFNNQITFETRARPTAPIYKFKVFHTGRIQLPGIQQTATDDVIECIDKITTTIRAAIPCGDPVYVRPVMKNYKFRVKIPAGCALSLTLLHNLIKHEHHMPSDDAPDHPCIFWAEYVRKKQKVTVTFRTPIPDDPNKHTTLAIMASGKINILGGLYAADTRAIFEFIHWLLRKNADKLLAGRPKLVEPAIRADLQPLGEDDMNKLFTAGYYDSIVEQLDKKHGPVYLGWVGFDE